MNTERKNEKIELNDQNLDMISGGKTIKTSVINQLRYCPVCGKNTAVEVYSGGRLKCKVCGTVVFG